MMHMIPSLAAPMTATRTLHRCASDGFYQPHPSPAYHSQSYPYKLIFLVHDFVMQSSIIIIFGICLFIVYRTYI